MTKEKEIKKSKKSRNYGGILLSLEDFLPLTPHREDGAQKTEGM